MPDAHGKKPLSPDGKTRVVENGKTARGLEPGALEGGVLRERERERESKKQAKQGGHAFIEIHTGRDGICRHCSCAHFFITFYILVKDILFKIW